MLAADSAAGTVFPVSRKVQRGPGGELFDLRSRNQDRRLPAEIAAVRPPAKEKVDRNDNENGPEQEQHILYRRGPIHAEKRPDRMKSPGPVCHEPDRPRQQSEGCILDCVCVPSPRPFADN